MSSKVPCLYVAQAEYMRCNVGMYMQFSEYEANKFHISS